MKWKKVRLDLQPFRGAWRQAGSKKTTEMDASWQQIWTGAWWVELLISSLSARGITTPSLYGWSSEVRPCKPSLDEPLLDFSNSCLFSPLSTSPRRKKKTPLFWKISVFTHISRTYHKAAWKWKARCRTTWARSLHALLRLWLELQIKSRITEHFVLI